MGNTIGFAKLGSAHSSERKLSAGQPIVINGSTRNIGLLRGTSSRHAHFGQFKSGQTAYVDSDLKSQFDRDVHQQRFQQNPQF